MVNTMENPKKEAYEAPQVVDYGAVSELTRQGAEPNADVPGGVDGTAYSP